MLQSLKLSLEPCPASPAVSENKSSKALGSVPRLGAEKMLGRARALACLLASPAPSVGFGSRHWNFVAKGGSPLKLHPRAAAADQLHANNGPRKEPGPRGRLGGTLPRPLPCSLPRPRPRQRRSPFTLALAKFSPSKLRPRGLSRVHSLTAGALLPLSAALSGNWRHTAHLKSCSQELKQLSPGRRGPSSEDRRRKAGKYDVMKAPGEVGRKGTVCVREIRVHHPNCSQHEIQKWDLAYRREECLLCNSLLHDTV